MNRVLVNLSLLLLVLTGCQRPPSVVPTLFGSGQINPLADEPVVEQSATRSIFYVTDRVGLQNKGKLRYSRERSDGMEAGLVRVRYGKKDTPWAEIAQRVASGPGHALHDPEMIGIKRFGQIETEQMQHAPSTVRSPEQTPTQGTAPFIQALNTALARSAGKTITIYTHGFNSSFKNAALDTADYELMTGGLGPFILYSWPSYNSLLEYSHDRDSVRYTAGHARHLIELLANEIQQGRLHAKQINFIAHSTGAEIVGSVLRELALISRNETAQQRQERWRIGRVVLVSPDVSADVARQRLLKEDLAGMFQSITVYSSLNDHALRWASYILYRTARIGAISESKLTEADRYWLSQRDQVAIVDVDSRPYFSFVNHSHHRFSPAVVSDIVLSLRSTLPPAERGLVRCEGEVIWRFPDDYPAAISQAAQRIYPPIETTGDPP